MPCILAASQIKAWIWVLVKFGESQKSGSISKDGLQEQKKGYTCYLNKLFVANALPSSNAYNVCIDSENCQLVFVRGNCVSLKHFTKDSM